MLEIMKLPIRPQKRRMELPFGNKIESTFNSSKSISRLPGLESVTTINEDDADNHDNFYKSLRPILIFGKFIGLIPIQGVFNKINVPENLIFRTISFGACYSLLACTMLTVLALGAFIGMFLQVRKVASQYAWTPAMLIFYASGLFVYVYLYRQSGNLIKLLTSWNDVRVDYTMPDKKLCRHVNLIAWIIIISAILENVTGHLIHFGVDQKYQGNMNVTGLELYYEKSHDLLVLFIPYHPVLAIFVLISNKLSFYAINFMDVIIAAFSRALYSKFKSLHLIATEKLLHETKNISGNNNDTAKWNQLVMDFDTLLELLTKTQHFLSPLIFVSYAVNTYFTFLLLIPPAYDKKSVVSRIYANWSVLHLIARIVIITLMGSRVHDWIHKMSYLIRKCPPHAMSHEMQRLEHYLGSNVIGLSGLGCFTIRKPLTLQIISIILTFDIVLLQAAQIKL